MAKDKIKFVSLKENKTGKVTFDNDEAGKFRRKCTVRLNNGRGKDQDVLFVDSIKNNLLSASQMCDKWCDVLFRFQGCEIRSTSTGKVVAKAVRTENNVYILKEYSDELYINKQDES